MTAQSLESCNKLHEALLKYQKDYKLFLEIVILNIGLFFLLHSFPSSWFIGIKFELSKNIFSFNSKYLHFLLCQPAAKGLPLSPTKPTLSKAIRFDQRKDYKLRRISACSFTLHLISWHFIISLLPLRNVCKGRSVISNFLSQPELSNVLRDSSILHILSDDGREQNFPSLRCQAC